MNILIINPSSLEFDVSTVDTQGIGGTEASVCYLARELAKAGHKVELNGSPSPESGGKTIHGVLHSLIRSLPLIHGPSYDVCITVNSALLARYVKEKCPTVRSMVWFHMMPDQPSLQQTGYHLPSVDDVIYVSESQKKDMERYYGVHPRSHIIGGALAPAFENMFSSPEDLLAQKKLRAVYTSTPFRGLTYLLDVAERIPEMPFEIFSSMKLYQMDDKEYEPIYARAKNMENVFYYGCQSQSSVAQNMKTAAFYTYPCIFKETFCLGAIEALAAGMTVVSTQYGALLDTTMGLADLIPIDYVDSKNFVRGFTDEVKWSMAQFQQKPERWAEDRWLQVKEINDKYSWSSRIKEWEALWTSSA